MNIVEMEKMICHRSMSGEYERECIGDKCMACRQDRRGNYYCKDFED